MAAALPALDGTTRLGVIGLGYVGLPVAIAFSKHFVVYGFDKNGSKIRALQQGEDSSGVLSSPEEITGNEFLYLYAESEPLTRCQVLLVTVPTPITSENKPDLTLLEEASETIGRRIRPGSVVILESTVYPGVTEDVCVPIIETESGLKLNQDFFVGYSPERVNPGDSQHRLDNVVKVTSGSTPEVAEFVAQLYEKIVHVGVHRAPSIRVAEAAKVIENIQRDLNIALVNEFAQLFHHLGLDTGDILEAARTKWNFLPFRPGLVGGHCIGVDPYYLTYKAEESGYSPDVILSGRTMNNSVPTHITERLYDLLADRGKELSNSRVLVMGLTFKENLPDVRNSKAIEVAIELAARGAMVDCYDPVADLSDSDQINSLSMVQEPETATYDAIVVAVAHDEIKALSVDDIKHFGTDESVVIFDVQHLFSKDQVSARL